MVVLFELKLPSPVSLEVGSSRLELLQGGASKHLSKTLQPGTTMPLFVSALADDKYARYIIVA